MLSPLVDRETLGVLLTDPLGSCPGERVGANQLPPPPPRGHLPAGSPPLAPNLGLKYRTQETGIFAAQREGGEGEAQAGNSKGQVESTEAKPSSGLEFRIR